MAKKILLTKNSAKGLHKLWLNYLLHPPRGVDYYNLNDTNIKQDFLENQENLSRNSDIKNWRSRVYRFLFDLRNRIPFLLIHTKYISDKLISKKIDQIDSDLIYALNGRLYFGKKPWIVDFENPTAFTQFNIPTLKKYREKIGKVLRRSNCKGIFSYSEAGRESFEKIFKDPVLTKKLIAADNCIPSLPNSKKIKHKGFNILFTGSINQMDHFYLRGGRELVRAFLKICDKYPDMKLVLRCKVPDKYVELLKGKNVEIIEDLLPEKQFNDLFNTSDLFVLPAYIGFALSTIEAMSFGLPVIVSDFLENGEMIEQGVEGYKISPPKINYLLPNIPNYYGGNTKIGSKLKLDDRYIKEISKRMEELYLNKPLRLKMGKAGIKRVENKFLTSVKNKKFKEIFDSV